MDLPLPLARVKLVRPTPAREIVARDRLVRRLQAALTHPVTLIAAPAGYGKTTLLVHWLEHVSMPAAWVTLDQDDNNPAIFCSYLVAAIEGIFPGALSGSRSRVNAGGDMDSLAFATTLSNELSDLPGDFVFVLDDYHSIKDTTIHSLLGHLLRRLPEHLHLILSTRLDAPLPLPKLRSSGLLTELRARDLRFTSEETSEFLRRTVGRDLAPTTIELLHSRTEGWPAGLRFASVLLHEDGDEADLVRQMVSAERRPLMNWMLDEVLAAYPPEVQTFLLVTSVIGRFNLDLARAITAPEKQAAIRSILNELLLQDSLVIPDREGWYRYHNLFQDFLGAEAHAALDETAIAQIHLNAGEWYARQGMITEAIQQALAGNDLERGARLVYENLHAALNREDARAILILWLALFPAGYEETHIELLLARLWLTTLQFQVAGAQAVAERANKLLEKKHKPDPRRHAVYAAEIAYALAAKAVWTNENQTALDLAARHYPALPREYAFARGNFLLTRAMALQQKGMGEAALALLTEELRGEGEKSPQFAMRLLVAFAVLHLNNADFTNTAQTAENIRRLARGEHLLSVIWSYYISGLVHYEWNNLETAAQFFAAASEFKFAGNLKGTHESLAWLALTQQAQGLADTATQTMRDLSSLTVEMHFGALAYDSNAYEARLALARGETDLALRWAHSVSFNPNPHMIFEVEPRLTRFMALLASRKAKYLDQLLAESEQILEAADNAHNVRRVIQLMACRALALEGTGQRIEALDALEHAITLAEPGGFIRSFLDLGPDMPRLLNLLLARKVAPDYIGRILMASAGSRRAPARSQSTRQEVLIEPLTVRELQILEQLAMRRTDKEIAQNLVISPLTVKAHTDHIYHKLGVKNRQEAVNVGYAYGLLEKPPVE